MNWFKWRYHVEFAAWLFSAMIWIYLLAQNCVQEVFRGKLSGANLQEVQIGVDHGVAKIGLNVSHRLAFDL